MKLKSFVVSLGFMMTFCVVSTALAAQGNQAGIKPAIFPVSPITPPPAVPTQFDVTGHIQSAAVDQRVCPGSSMLDR
jgi:hypothetical protein